MREGRWTRSRRTCSMSCCRRAGRGPPGAGPVRRKARLHAESDMTPAEVGRGRAGIPGRPCRNDPAWRRAVVDLGARPAAGRPERPAEELAIAERDLVACSTRSRATIPPAEDILDFCRDELVRIEDFVATATLIGLADEPLEIRWTPTFMRAYGGAMLDSPGPLDKGQTGFFADHADPRATGRPSRRSPTCARTTSGCSGCSDHPRGRARPLPPGRLRQPLPVADARASSGAACSPRAGRST